MGLSSTLYTGISGLKANSEAMSVTGNNISNSNTIGFKSSSTLFSDVLSARVSSAGSSSQVGRGVQISGITNIFSQGSFSRTASNTDLAIDGDGFFMVRAPDEVENCYTRNGSFSFNKMGYLVTAGGYRVQGKAYENGVLSGGDPTDIKVDFNSQIAARQTSTLTLTTNLDSAADIIPAFDIADPKNTSSYSTQTKIFDSLGGSHAVTTYFTKTADNTWEWHMTVDSDELASSVAGTTDLTELGSGVLTFDDSGNLLSGETGATLAGAIDWNNGSSSGQRIALTFDTTQRNNSSRIISQSQDGYAPGEVVDVSVDDEGTVIASYSNGEKINIAQLTLATFNNCPGLEKRGGSLYAQTAASGDPSVGTVGASQGYIYTSSLELSNVDLAQEFVDLITIQNGYSASSKVITTTDEMLQELINLKR